MAANFRFSAGPIEGLIVIEPEVFGDGRGFFMESYAERDFAQAGITARFVQDNHSGSKRGVLRGLHIQRNAPQGKLVRVVSGGVLDVGVDLRAGSATFGRWFSVELNAADNRQVYLPPGFAHGFLSLEDDTQLLYKCTEYYDPASDGGIRWDDPGVAVDWQLDKYGIKPDDLILSDKDKALPPLSSWVCAACGE